MRWLSLAVLLVVAMSASSDAEARDAGVGPTSSRSFCSADYARFCGGMDTAAREAAACLRGNLRDASPGCQAAVAEFGLPGEGPSTSR